MTSTEFLASFGIKSCFSQAVKTSAFTLLSNRPAETPAVRPVHQQRFADQRANRVRTPFCVPILDPVASLANRRITMGTRHVMGKAAFVNINNRAAFKRVMTNNRLEDTPCDGACLGMLQRFFYS